jgi:hypothetical protein
MTDLHPLVEQWVAEGIISAEQGGRILERQNGAEARSLRGSLIAEALSYVGGILVLLATVIIAALYWPSLTLAARSGLTGGAAAIVLAAGFLLPSAMGAARRRLRAVLWAIAVAMIGLWVGITLDGLHWRDETGVLVAASAAAVVALFLWGYQKTFLQQAALGVALLVATGSAVAHLPRGDDVVVGVAVWALGLAWLALAWGDLIPPRRTAYVLGGAAIIFGGQLTARHDWGLALAGVSVVALVTAAVLIHDLWLLAVGAVGVLITVPVIIDRFYQHQLAAPLALLAAGAVMIALGVFVARRRTEVRRSAATTISATWAISLAAIVIAVMTPVVLFAGGLW